MGPIQKDLQKQREMLPQYLLSEDQARVLLVYAWKELMCYAQACQDGEFLQFGCEQLSQFSAE